MTNKDKEQAQEIAKANYHVYSVCIGENSYAERTSEIECRESARDMARWKDKQTAEALHKACLAIMEDLGSKLGKIQLKAAAVLNNIPDEYVLDKMDEIIDAASDINKFAETFESYLSSQLGIKQQ